MSSSEPSDLALKHEREIGKLNEGLESVDSRLGGVERKVDTGFERVFTLLDGFRDRLAPKNNSALYLGVAGLMLAHDNAKDIGQMKESLARLSSKP